MMHIVSGISFFLFAGGVPVELDQRTTHHAIATSTVSEYSFIPITPQKFFDDSAQTEHHIISYPTQSSFISNLSNSVTAPSLILAHNQIHSAKSGMTKETAEGLYVVGRHEWILLGTSKEYFSAYVDQGSKNSRIGVSELVEFEREGKDWVKFILQGKEYKHAISEWVKDIKKSDKSLPAIKLRTKLGDINEEIEYVLINGGNGIVLGENFLRDLAVQNTQYDYIQGRVKQ